jgi:hypothetical protein
MKSIKLKVIISSTLLFIAGSLAFYSCSKSTKIESTKTESIYYKQLNLSMYKTQISSTELSPQLINSEVISSFLTTKSLKIDSEAMVEFYQSADNQSRFYTVKLKEIKPLRNNITYTLNLEEIFTNTGIWRPILLKDEILANGEHEYNAIEVYRNLNLFHNLDNPALDLYNLQEWQDCMTSAWSVLTDDLTRSVTCGLAPGPCLAACVIHCTAKSVQSGFAFNPTQGQLLLWLYNQGHITCSEYLQMSNIIVNGGSNQVIII